MESINPQVQEAQQITSTKDIEKTTLGHIMIKVLKANGEEKALKLSEGKRKTHYAEEQK